MAKIKMKTHKGLAKRVKKTASGKLKRWSAFTGHLAHNKSVKQRRKLRKSGLISSGDMKRIKHMLHN
ncbi:50S ribosomal protein L35 [Erysipelotrichaceae bacterium]|nr:50S ribosomal protein L35 [Erysipelotrichaceae bacterium]